jgi:phosphate starvation-inducible PhoH-like protein
MTKTKRGKRTMDQHQHEENDKELFVESSKYSSPRNKSQTKLMQCLTTDEYKIILASGPAGTGKTLFSVEQGIKHFLSGKYNKIIFTRPSVSVDENIGFLPGTLEDKMLPWMRPIYDIFHNFMTQKDINALITDEKIEISPLGFMRGRTFKNCWIVADEMQNSTIAQMKMLLTRIGENTRLVITGDCEQNDMRHGMNGLEDFLNKMKGRRSDSIGSVEFGTDDVEREKVVREVLEIYKTNHVPYIMDDESNNDK